FTYISAPDYSLERKNPYLSDYSADNWAEHISANTVGLINSIFSTGTIPSDPPTTTPTSTPIIDTSTLWQNIKINEFACAPQGDENEWVEFYNNSTTSLDLTGGYLCDERGATSTSGCKSINGIISANAWFLFDLDTRSFLNNSGDSVILRNDKGEEMDKIIYNGDLIPESGQSLARKKDGQDTDNNLDWAITTSLTKNSTNIITAPVVNIGGGGTYIPPVVLEIPILTVLAQTSDKIVLNEIYPDPVGSDTADEFIEIRNTGTETVNLSGWTISDLVKKYVLSGNLGAGEIAVYKREKTGIALNNSTLEEVKLADSSGKIVDKINYNKAFEGQSYMRDDKGNWLWTAEITPGLTNKYVNVDNLGITVDIKYPKTAEIGEIVIFDASESSDSRGGTLGFLWNFSDNSTLTGEEISKIFATSGIFTAKLVVTSSLGDSVDKTIEIKVDYLENLPKRQVIISEVLPNPEGTDKGEFIELYNMDETGVDLSGWKLKNKNNKIYTIPEAVKIEPKSFLILYQEVTKLTLTNTEDKIFLLDENDETVDLVKYEKAPEGKSYCFFDGAWFWTTEINPGKLLEKQNEVSLSSVKSSGKGYLIKNLSEVRESEVGDLVITQGTVVVLPNIFGTQYMYVTDGESGIQIYNFKKDWPQLKVGDVIKVKGEISNAQGVQRLKTKTKADFVILENNAQINFVSTTLEELNEENLGALVKLSGEITSIKSNYFYLDDGNDEIVVYLKKNTGIDKKNFKVGDMIEVVGILEVGKAGWQVWPRGQTDITKTRTGGLTQNQELNSENNSKETAGNYITATLGGFSALFFGVLFKNKGAIFKTALALVGKWIKRG
ncbi:MAG TPA: lamin tail domain-containing protein, partial [Candidatus Magasanikbacteria bacterium]|nr:lamin tail domain-containing protein [Candidatus Magasanikbacteria bacterium]